MINRNSSSCAVHIKVYYYFYIFLFQISQKVDELLEVRENLHGTWIQQKDHLDHVYDQQMFYREANHLQAISTSQEAYLKSAVNAGSVEQVETLVKKHEAFEKLLLTQDTKVSIFFIALNISLTIHTVIC